jgi:hypothetical protein
MTDIPKPIKSHQRDARGGLPFNGATSRQLRRAKARGKRRAEGVERAKAVSKKCGVKK